MEALLEEKLPDTKRKLIEAAVALMLRQGFTATTVDQVCAEAGVTKGSFFHYFKTKEEIGQASVRYFSQQQCEAIACAGLEKISDPLDRFHALLDCFAGMARHPQFPKACLVGNLTQELSQTHPEIRACCAESFEGFTTDVSAMLQAAKAAHSPRTDFDPASVAQMVLSLMQGSLLVAKARQDVGVLLANIEHCRAYVDGFFKR